MFKILTNNGMENKVKMVKIDHNSQTGFNTEFKPLIGKYIQLKIGEQFELLNENNVWIIRTGNITKIELFTNNQLNITTESGSEYILIAL